MKVWNLPLEQLERQLLKELNEVQNYVLKETQQRNSANPINIRTTYHTYMHGIYICIYI
mgnify:CR=1 FL=1